LSPIVFGGIVFGGIVFGGGGGVKAVVVVGGVVGGGGGEVRLLPSPQKPTHPLLIVKSGFIGRLPNVRFPKEMKCRIEAKSGIFNVRRDVDESN
jgi:hypothetical protein